MHSRDLSVEVGCSGNLFGEAFSLDDLWGVAFSRFTEVRAFALPAAIHPGIVSRL